jgi:hypothetical protein
VAVADDVLLLVPVPVSDALPVLVDVRVAGAEAVLVDVAVAVAVTDCVDVPVEVAVMDCVDVALPVAVAVAVGDVDALTALKGVKGWSSGEHSAAGSSHTIEPEYPAGVTVAPAVVHVAVAPDDTVTLHTQAPAGQGEQVRMAQAQVSARESDRREWRVERRGERGEGRGERGEGRGEMGDGRGGGGGGEGLKLGGHGQGA